MKPRFVAAAIALAATALMMSACGASPAHRPGPTDGMTPAQAAVEYQHEETGLTLAPEWKWPAKPAFNATGPDGASVMYQRGYGREHADWYWFCSWGNVLLAPTSTDAQRTGALTTLGKIRGLYYYNTSLLPRDRAQFEQELKSAELGDLSTITNDVHLNCPTTSA